MTKLDEILEKLEEASSLWQEYAEEVPESFGTAQFWNQIRVLSVRIPALRNEVEDFIEKFEQ